MLKIQRAVEGSSVIFMLSGRIKSEDIPQLQRLFAAEIGMNIVVDLQDVELIDREGVRFLAREEAHGITLTNCPSYVREWMGTEGTQT